MHRKAQRPMRGYAWDKLKRVTEWKPLAPELVAAWMKEFNIDEAEARRRIAAHRDSSEAEWYVNSLYQVELRRDQGDTVWLCIRRRDGYPGRDWQHFQQIKNELLGEQCEAVELYPAEDRRVDTSNKYHLFGVSDPQFRFPFGYTKRDVRHDASDVPGLRQAPPLSTRGADDGQ